jgi:tetratricopeptide (TPR) repeat protein
MAALACLAQAQEAAPDIPTLMQAGNAAHMKGDYETARQSYAKAWDAAQQTADSDPVRYEILRRLTSVRAAAGEFADADSYLQMAIHWRESVLGRNDPKIADDLLVSVGLCRGMKDYDRARAILTRVMGLHYLQHGAESTVIADDFSRTAQIYMEQKRPEAAVGALTTALGIRTKALGPLDPSLVPDLDRLAGAHIVLRAYDKAELAYRQALVIRETLLGKEDADLIATVDGLAYACFGQQKFAEAEPIYQRLIALWGKSVGEDHPMVAMALDKVATFYFAQKRFDEAREAASRAIAIRALFLATGLSAQAAEQLLQGHKDAAVGHYRRALLVLDPPHPVYEELKGQIEGLVKALDPPAAPAKKGAGKKK